MKNALFPTGFSSKNWISKKKIILALFSAGLLTMIFYLSTEPFYTPTAISTPQHLTHFPKYIAHKAIFSKLHRGNTLQAIQDSLNNGINAIEVDIRLSKDHIPFLYHGDRLEEETNGFGSPEEHNWEELQKFHYIDNSDAKILSLEDLFKLVGAQIFIFLDIKSKRLTNGIFAEQIAALINKYFLQDSIIVESLNPFFLISMRLQDRKILVMYDFTLNATAQGLEKQSQFDQIPWILKTTICTKTIPENYTAGHFGATV